MGMSEFTTKTNSSQGGLPLRAMAILLLVAFIGGIILAGWAAQRYNLFGNSREDTTSQAVVDTPEQSDQESKAVRAVTNSPSLAVAETRVGDLENRLSQINADAQAASGNAARAEGMLIAFAARRAIDSGAPLGYVADQLQLRFGSVQPQAVLTIINAAPTPITLDMLQSDLTNLGDTLTSSQEGGIWETIKREMSELFVLRKEGAPSPAPRQRLLRAQRLTEAGNIEDAVKEIQALPGAVKAQSWLDKARRYLVVRDALDNVERAAIMTTPPLIPQGPVVPNNPSAQQTAPVPVTNQ